MPHPFLHHGIAAAGGNALYHLVVRQYRAQLRAPVHHRIAQVGDAVVHQRLLPLTLALGVPFLGAKAQLLAASRVHAFRATTLKSLYQLPDGARLPCMIIIITLEHPLESPLRPMVITGVARTYLTIPIERETNLIQLLAVAVYIVHGGDSRMLAGLDGVLLGG